MRLFFSFVENKLPFDPRAIRPNDSDKYLDSQKKIGFPRVLVFSPYICVESKFIGRAGAIYIV
jgi:hypothetical protein